MGRLVILLSQLGLHNGAATLHGAITPVDSSQFDAMSEVVGFWPD
jgi:hypothetical protein